MIRIITWYVVTVDGVIDWILMNRFTYWPLTGPTPNINNSIAISPILNFITSHSLVFLVC
jgi:hypothetical protein